jgi:glycerophosphodiester phosphodiesterase
MLFEAAEDWKSDTFAIEVNTFVDTILASVFSHPSCQHRPIILSSFSPEICILVSLKQKAFPIFFLNESGNNPVGDIRSSSIQEAIHFATSWGLDGIIMAAEAFVCAPKLVGVAKVKGLVTGSWGAPNNEPECAKVSAVKILSIFIVLLVIHTYAKLFRLTIF